MRAADALFARPSPAERAPEAGRHAAPPRIPLEADEPQSTAASPDRGGRILRAIDEAPPPQFAALEAAYAPKRRGRKPGSKNKPKAPAISPAETTAADRPAEQTPQAARIEAAAVPPAMEQLEGIALPDAAAPQAALRGDRRTPWLRDRLKPGEGWKRRRLPRVCW